MKYIITESQYNKAIDSFITYQFEPHEEKTIGAKILWIKDNNVIAGIPNSKYFFVDIEIWANIQNILSLDLLKTQLVIKNWLEKNYNFGELKPWPVEERKMFLI